MLVILLTSTNSQPLDELAHYSFGGGVPSAIMSSYQQRTIMIHPKAGQVWTNTKTGRMAIISKIIDYDRILMRYDRHNAYDCCYQLFLETHKIDVEESVKNLQKQVDVLLYDIQELKVKDT